MYTHVFIDYRGAGDLAFWAHQNCDGKPLFVLHPNNDFLPLRSLALSQGVYGKRCSAVLNVGSFWYNVHKTVYWLMRTLVYSTQIFALLMVCFVYIIKVVVLNGVFTQQMASTAPPSLSEP